MTSDTRMRTRVAAAVMAYPGLHLRELARQLDTSVALVEYHVKALVEDRTLEIVEDKRFVRLYPARGRGRVPAPDRAAVQALRSSTGLALVLHLLSVDGARTHGELADASGLAKSTLSFHLRKLAEAGVIVQHDGKYQVRDPARVLRLLEEYRPTPDLLDRFARLWNGLYGPS